MVFDAFFCKLLAVRSVATLASSLVSCSGVGVLLLSARSDEGAIVVAGVDVRFPLVGAAAIYLAFLIRKFRIYIM